MDSPRIWRGCSSIFHVLEVLESSGRTNINKSIFFLQQKHSAGFRGMTKKHKKLTSIKFTSLKHECNERRILLSTSPVYVTCFFSCLLTNAPRILLSSSRVCVTWFCFQFFVNACTAHTFINFTCFS